MVKLLKREIEEFFARLKKHIPDPKTELQYNNPYTLLVAVALSAQATDKCVNKATEPLFKTVDTPEKMVALGEAKLTDAIKTIGLYRGKAKNVIALSKILIEKHGGKVPKDRDALQELPGVGRKTANVVLNVAFGEPTIAVDTHIFRVSNRTGLAPGKDVLAVELKLEKRVPEKYQLHAHHWLILHGRYTCVARKPLCPDLRGARSLPFCRTRSRKPPIEKAETQDGFEALQSAKARRIGGAVRCRAAGSRHAAPWPASPVRKKKTRQDSAVIAPHLDRAVLARESRRPRQRLQPRRIDASEKLSGSPFGGGGGIGTVGAGGGGGAAARPAGAAGPRNRPATKHAQDSKPFAFHVRLRAVMRWNRCTIKAVPNKGATRLSKGIMLARAIRSAANPEDAAVFAAQVRAHHRFLMCRSATNSKYSRPRSQPLAARLSKFAKARRPDIKRQQHQIDARGSTPPASARRANWSAKDAPRATQPG